MDIEEIVDGCRESLAVEVDGKAGPVTWKAIYEEIVGTDSRSAPNIAALTEGVDLIAVAARQPPRRRIQS
jgi:hypothetical protein